MKVQLNVCYVLNLWSSNRSDIWWCATVKSKRCMIRKNLKNFHCLTLKKIERIYILWFMFMTKKYILMINIHHISCLWFLRSLSSVIIFFVHRWLSSKYITFFVHFLLRIEWECFGSMDWYLGCCFEFNVLFSVEQDFGLKVHQILK